MREHDIPVFITFTLWLLQYDLLQFVFVQRHFLKYISFMIKKKSYTTEETRQHLAQVIKINIPNEGLMNFACFQIWHSEKDTVSLKQYSGPNA